MKVQNIITTKLYGFSSNPISYSTLALTKVRLSQYWTHLWKQIVGHYWPLQLFSQGYWSSFSYHLCCVCKFLYISGGIYNLKSTPKDRLFFFFENFFMAVLIYSQSFCQKFGERKSPKKYFSYLMSGLGLEPWLFL